MIARVAFPIAISGIFDYNIPEQMRPLVIPGVPVKVELRSRKLWGVAVAIAETSSVSNLKDIIEIKSGQGTESSGALIQLYQWIASYYQTDMGKVFKPFIRKRIAELNPRTITVYSFSGMLSPLLSVRQRAAADLLKDMEEAHTARQLHDRYGISTHTITALASLGVLNKSIRTTLREALEAIQEKKEEYVELTREQKNAVEAIWQQNFPDPKPVLLYGITGSGKTHVYIELAKRTLAQGKAVIILVPEISLTPQTIRRFRDALECDIAVIHSRMSEGERRDSVEEIVSGRRRIVIGVRSAILVPMDSVGLIVVDEEHDGSYKQSDTEPRYHARDVAVMRGYYQKAVVVLGSATPCFESYYNTVTGKYALVTLSRRFGEAALPNVTVVDMNSEHRENNWTILSRYLQGKVRETIEQKRQIILLLNRRGFSVALICKDCGHTYTCPNCSVHLIYHRVGALLRCH